MELDVYLYISIPLYELQYKNKLLVDIYNAKKAALFESVLSGLFG